MNACGINTFIKLDSYPDILTNNEPYIPNDQLPEIELVVEKVVKDDLEWFFLIYIIDYWYKDLMCQIMVK